MDRTYGIDITKYYNRLYFCLRMLKRTDLEGNYLKVAERMMKEYREGSEVSHEDYKKLTEMEMFVGEQQNL